MDFVSRQYIKVIRWFEFLLALAVFAGVVAAAVGGLQVLVRQDWRVTETFYDLIYRVLLLVIGIELVRMLIIHDLMAVLELLAFVIARKMLKPDILAIDIILAVLAFVALLGARRYFATPQDQHPKGAGSPPQAN